MRCLNPALHADHPLDKDRVCHKICKMFIYITWGSLYLHGFLEMLASFTRLPYGILVSSPMRNVSSVPIYISGKVAIHCLVKLVLSPCQQDKSNP